MASSGTILFFLPQLQERLGTPRRIAPCESIPRSQGTLPQSHGACFVCFLPPKYSMCPMEFAMCPMEFAMCPMEFAMCPMELVGLASIQRHDFLPHWLVKSPARREPGTCCSWRPSSSVLRPARRGRSGQLLTLGPRVQPTKTSLSRISFPVGAMD